MCSVDNSVVKSNLYVNQKVNDSNPLGAKTVLETLQVL